MCIRKYKHELNKIPILISGIHSPLYSNFGNLCNRNNMLVKSCIILKENI